MEFEREKTEKQEEETGVKDHFKDGEWNNKQWMYGIYKQPILHVEDWCIYLKMITAKNMFSPYLGWWNERIN